MGKNEIFAKEIFIRKSLDLPKGDINASLIRGFMSKRYTQSIEIQGVRMAAKIYINLPVKDIGRSVDFFCQLGFSPNALFSDEKSACLVVTQEIAVMLLKKEYFQTFTNKPIANTKENN